MKPRLVLFLVVIGFALAGCQSQPGQASSGKPVEASTTGNGTTGGKEQETAPPVVPEDLKSEAYHWYGLSNLNPTKIEIDMSGQPQSKGDQTIKLVSAKDGKVRFDIERPGPLGTENI